MQITDDDLYFYYGSKYLNLNSRYKQAPDLFNEERKKLSKGEGSREDIIAYAKKSLRAPLPNAQEYIKREDWLPFEDLTGERQEVLDNPIWNKTQKFIFENFKPSSTSLIIQRCSSRKPYIDNGNYKFTKILQEHKLCDLAVASLEIIPIDFTIYYPFRQYDWNDKFETPELTEYAINRKTNRIIQLIDHFGYQKILILGPGFEGDTYYKIITDKLKKHYKNSKEIYFVMDEETTNKCIETMNGYKGLAKVRYPNLKPTQERICKLLGVENPQKKIERTKLW